MKQGVELYRWAEELATNSVAADATYKAGHPTYTALAIAEAYLRGATDALTDEIERKRARA